MSSDSSVQTKPVPAPTFLPLTSLRESPTNPRKFFDAKALSELAASVKEHGIIEPLIVRANGKPFESEIICGARRFRAAKIAGLPQVPVIFRELSDADVRVIQLVENGQRADLSPIEEAETYAALAEEGLAVAQIAKRVGREPREVARRLPLAKLPRRVKDALSSGVLPAEHAQLIARIPDAKLQEEALGRMLEDVGEETPILRAVAYPIAKRIVEEEFMTALSVAVFDPDDAALSPLGACSKCLHLAGNNPDLFGDVKGKAVCTNPKDFRLKTENHLKRLRESGYTVLLSPKELKRAFPYGDSDQLGKEFVDLETVCPDDPKHRTYGVLLGGGEKLKTVFALKNGRVRKLYPARDLRTALISSGHAFAKAKSKRTSEKQKERLAANYESIGHDAVARELAAKLRTLKLTPSGWIDLLLRAALALHGWKIERVLRRHGFDGSPQEFARDREKIIAKRLDEMSDADKRSFLVDLLIGDFLVSPNKAQEEVYRYALKLAGINLATVANRAIDEAKRNAAAAKPTAKPPIAAKVARAGNGADKSPRRSAK